MYCCSALRYHYIIYIILHIGIYLSIQIISPPSHLFKTFPRNFFSSLPFYVIFHFFFFLYPYLFFLFSLHLHKHMYNYNMGESIYVHLYVFLISYTHLVWLNLYLVPLIFFPILISAILANVPAVLVYVIQNQIF